MDMMQVEDYAKLLEDVEYELCRGRRSVGVLGLTPVTTQLLRSLAPSGLVQAVQAVYVPDGDPASPHHLSCRYDGLKRCQKHNMTYWSLRLTLTRKTSYSQRYRI